MSKNKEWCEYYDRGSRQCRVEGLTPSLAILCMREVPEDEVIELKDRNSVLNFLHLFDLFEDGMNVPNEATVQIKKKGFIPILLCLARNCRSKQKKCDHFK